MDANNTRYHLLHGERDWLSVLLKQSVNKMWWDRERKSISLAPIVRQINKLEQRDLLQQAQRRGAAFDHYGNIYWVNEQRNGIDYQPAATPRQRGQFWHVEELKRSSQLDRDHGDFKPVQAGQDFKEPDLSGLAITTHEYLVVGTLQPAGLLVFDLHAGGPPDWLRWPDEISFAPYDISCAPGGGLWILDRDINGAAANVWLLDKNFRILSDNGAVVPLNNAVVNDFHAHDESVTQQTGQSGFESAIALSQGSPALVNDAVAIEALSDHAFIILGSPTDGEPSCIYYFNHNELKDRIMLDESVIGGLLEMPVVVGHDFAFQVDGNLSTHSIVNGLLTVAAVSSTQSFEFALRASENELELALQPKLLPMNDYSGKALIASAKSAVYDFTERNLPSAEQSRTRVESWLPLTEQPGSRYQSKAEIAGIIKDGAEPDCVWHRIIMDAGIPPGTSIVVESRAANDQQLLQELPWQLEPVPHLRSEGSELPMHQPFDDKQTVPDFTGSWDLLFQNAVGRYIELRLTLLGSQRATPRIRAMRIYYPRYSYLNRYLPAVYREDQESASFMDRFLANVEGLYTGLEDKISQAQTLFDTRTTPAEFLEWLGGWLGAFIDPSWDDNRKRLFIDHAFLLFRWRGTPLGLWTMIKLNISECPDASLFEPLKLVSPFKEDGLSGRDVRIVENFLTRRSAGLVPDDTLQSTTLIFEGSDSAWKPILGAGILHQKYQRFVSSKYSTELGFNALNEAWGSDYKQLDKILFPPQSPLQQVQQRDWHQFIRDFLGFSYADVSSADLPLYQEFLARRYQQISRLNSAHGLLGEFKHVEFSDLVLPDELPRQTTALEDWIEFVSMVLPIKEQAHQFTVLLPTVLGELPSIMERRRAQVEALVKREKPAHTDFEVKFFWALFQVGSARLGLDTSLGEGSRFVAMVLGANFLGQSFVAESHPWSVVDRSVIGRDRLRTYE